MTDYTPIPGSVPARVVAHFLDLPEGTELSTPQLAEAIGQPSSFMIPCLAHARRHGVVVARKAEESLVRSPLLWRLGTKEDRKAAELELADRTSSTAAEHAEDTAADRPAQHARTPGPQSLGWTPAKPLYAPPAELEEPVDDAEEQPAREKHLAIRAWFCSDGQMVIETREHEFVFPRLEAQQLLRAVKGLREMAA